MLKHATLCLIALPYGSNLAYILFTLRDGVASPGKCTEIPGRSDSVGLLVYRRGATPDYVDAPHITSYACLRVA